MTLQEYRQLRSQKPISPPGPEPLVTLKGMRVDGAIVEDDDVGRETRIRLYGQAKIDPSKFGVIIL